MHEQILQPGEFFIPKPLGRPTEKLGDTIDKINYYRKQGNSIYNSIVKAAKDCGSGATFIIFIVAILLNIIIFFPKIVALFS